MSIEELQQITPSIHFTLQGKGGVGKSFVSAMLAQYFLNRGDDVRCFDTDPVNPTLSRFRSLNVTHLDLLKGSLIDDRKFDNLVELLTSSDSTFVVDNGASSFVPMSNYLIENDVIPMLAELNRDVYVHCVIKGGQDLLDTVGGFKVLAEQPGIETIVVWLNEHFGRIEADGKSFREMKAYLDHEEKVAGIIVIPERNPNTFGMDVKMLTERNLTFAEALGNKEFSFMARRRLAMMRDDVFGQLERVGF